MTIAPFQAPVVGEGAQRRVLGRGACDVKGGIATILAVMSRIVQSGARPACDVVAVFACDEEWKQAGARDLAASWLGQSRPYRLSPAPPDLSLVFEPTGLDIVVAHRGVIRWRIETLGKAAHSSDPTQGDNAIYRMAEIVGRLQRHAQTLSDVIPPDPWCGPATLSVGTIRGGTSVNMVPDRCEIEVDRRVIPGETCESAREGCRAVLADLLGDYARFAAPDIELAPLACDALSENWAAQLLQSVQPVQPAAALAGAAYGCHAATYAAAGSPSLVWGPGSIEQAHTEDEWIELADIERAVTILQRFLMRDVELGVTDRR